MTTKPSTSPTFTYTMSTKVPISKVLLRKTLGEVRDQLLSHGINGGDRKFDMQTVCDAHKCGTVACIGGWASLFLLGFGHANADERGVADDLFSWLHNNLDDDGRLYKLFYEFGGTEDCNVPNVAATAIQRYLNGKDPWPEGEMPRVLPYTTRTTKRATKKR